MSHRPREQDAKNHLSFYMLEFSMLIIFFWRQGKKKENNNNKPKQQQKPTQVPLNSIHKKAVPQVAGSERKS